MTQEGFYTPPILNPVNYCMLTKLWQVRWKYFGLTRKLNIWRWHNWNWSHLIFVTYATYDVGVKFSCSCKKNPKMWKGKSLSKAMQKITKPRCFVLHKYQVWYWSTCYPLCVDKMMTRLVSNKCEHYPLLNVGCWYEDDTKDGGFSKLLIF